MNARIEVRIIGRVVSVRFARHATDCLRHWNELAPGSVDTQFTGWTYRELRALGAGLHTVRRKR